MCTDCVSKDTFAQNKMVTPIKPQAAYVRRYKFNNRSLNRMFPPIETKTSPVPVKPTLARSASKKGKDRMMSSATDRRDRAVDDMACVKNVREFFSIFVLFLLRNTS